MTKTVELMKQIAEVLAGYDKQVLDSLIASIPERRAAKKAVQARWDAGEFKGMYATNHYASAVLEAVGGNETHEQSRRRHFNDRQLAADEIERLRSENKNLQERVAQLDRAISRIGKAADVVCGGVDTEDDFGPGGHSAAAISEEIESLRADNERLMNVVKQAKKGAIAWVSAKYRLPKESEGEVLALMEDGTCEIAWATYWHGASNGFAQWSFRDPDEDRTPTHWIPLPAAPETPE